MTLEELIVDKYMEIKEPVTYTRITVVAGGELHIYATVVATEQVRVEGGPIHIHEGYLAVGPVLKLTFYIYDGATGKPIEGALVKANYHEGTTGPDGKIVFDVPAGTYAWEVSKVGYRGETGTVEVTKDTLVEVALWPLPKPPIAPIALLLASIIITIIIVLIIVALMRRRR